MYKVIFPVEYGLPQHPQWLNKSWDSTIYGANRPYMHIKQAVAFYRKAHKVKLNLNPVVRTSIDSAEFQSEEDAVMFMLRWA